MPLSLTHPFNTPVTTASLVIPSTPTSPAELVRRLKIPPVVPDLDVGVAKNLDLSVIN
jgi:hypothetical protein